jgi:hypothetical protein
MVIGNCVIPPVTLLIYRRKLTVWADVYNGRDPKIIRRSFMELHYRVTESSATGPVFRQPNSEQHISPNSSYKITIVSSTDLPSCPSIQVF